jgi:hypothetical protein
MHTVLDGNMQSGWYFFDPIDLYCNNSMMKKRRLTKGPFITQVQAEVAVRREERKIKKYRKFQSIIKTA